MATKPFTALDRACAAAVLQSIGKSGTRGTQIDRDWYDAYLQWKGLSRDDLNRALNRLAADGKIVIEASQGLIRVGLAGSKK